MNTKVPYEIQKQALNLKRDASAIYSAIIDNDMTTYATYLQRLKDDTKRLEYLMVQENAEVGR